MLDSLFSKVTDLKVCNFIKKRLQHKCVSDLRTASEEMSEDSSWGDRNSGDNDEFKGNDYFHFEEEVTVNVTDQSWPLSKTSKNSFKINKCVKPPDIHNFGHSPGKTTLLFSPIAACSDTKENYLLQKISVTEQGVLNAAYLVYKEHQNVQWTDLNSTFS